jgi:hypothetical protein
MATPRRRGQRNSQPLPSLTASGEVIDLSDKQLSQKINRQRSPWQQMAWNYRELIGELGAGIDYMSGIQSKVAYLPGVVADDDQPALPGSDAYKRAPTRVTRAAEEALNALPFRNGHAFTGIMATNLRVTGEAWLHGKSERRGGRTRETWSVLSTDEVQPVNNGLGIVEMPGTQPVPVGEDETLLRLWKPHPRWKRLPDSPLRRMLDTCEDIVLIGRELRAAARSRVAANGILLIPNELSLVRKPDGEPSDFQTELELTLLAPIANEGDAGAVVPVLLKGPFDQLEKVRHIVLARADSPELIAKLEASLGRLREGMDMPPDAGQSVKDMNHWSAWSVTTENWKNYLEPGVRVMVDSLTEAYLRPSLTMAENRGGWGLTEDEADLVQVWYDAGNVTENANRGEDAKELYDRGEVGGEYLRVALGAGKEDAPDEDEYRKMLTWKAAQAMTPELAGIMLAQALEGLGIGGVTQVVQGQVSRTPDRGAIEVGTPGGPNGSTRGGTSGAPGRAPTSPTPVEQPAGMQGAAAPQDVLDSVRLVTGDRLAEIEAALRDRLLVAADLAVLRALEKAGSRVRAAAQKDRTLAAEVKGLDAEDVCPLVGADRIAQLGLTEDSLLARAFEHLRGKFTAWTTSAVQAVARTVAEMLGLKLTDVAALTRRLAARIPAAWKSLEHRLRKRALDKLYGRHGDELRGEVPDTLVRPGDIRAALSEVGGLPPGGVDADGVTTRPDETLGGLALGRDITHLMGHAADPIGFSWKYGVTPRERQFEPHRRLNGHRFPDWDDAGLATDASTAWIGTHFAPGDHNGCLCDYVPTWAIAETFGTIATEIEPETVGMGTERLLAELDDAAGRRGTHAQRSRDERDRILAVQHAWMKETA